MFFYEGYDCPVCGRRFQETDDIVVCPKCGAPHHRDCWSREGHCHFESAHDTPQQWKRQEPAPSGPSTAAGTSGGSAADPSAEGGNPCPSCGFVNTQYAEFCSRCGKDLPATDWQSSYTPPVDGPPPAAGGNGGVYGEYSPFRMPVIDPYGGVDKNETIDDTPAEDLMTYTAVNTPYYLPRFKKIAGGKRASWNWPAFLITPYWLMFRKNYLAGGLVLFFTIMKTVVENLVIYRFLVGSDIATPAEYFNAIQAAAQDESKSVFFMIIMGLFLADLVIRLLFGLFGNSVYLGTAVARIHKLRTQDTVGYRGRLSAAGGISFAFAALSYAIIQFSSMLLVAFI
jgi:DNA-directed RNA polymerase subunit RPC12/RpoP